MNWLLKHASDVALAIVVALATKGVDYLLARRARVIAFFTHGATFRFFANDAWHSVNTMGLALQNIGRQTAADIRIVHRRKTLNFQVFPVTNASENLMPQGDWELNIPSILAKQTVFVSYIDGLQLDPSLISYMACSDHVIRQVPIQFARVLPKHKLYPLVFCFLLGAFVIIRFAFIWGTDIIRYLAIHWR